MIYGKEVRTLRNPLSTEEKAEIGRAILKEFLRTKGIDFKSDPRRDLGNIAKATGISMEKLTIYVHDIFSELFVDWWQGVRNAGMLDSVL